MTPHPKVALRFVAYYPVSTAQQSRSGLGLEAQHEAVGVFLAGGGGILAGEFTEIDSGKNNDRPNLARALEACNLTGAVLVIAKLDRLSRDTHFLQGLEKAGVEFIAADMPTANPLTVRLMAVIAQDERERISARTKAAFAAVLWRAGNRFDVANRDGSSECLVRRGVVPLAERNCGPPSEAVDCSACRAGSKADLACHPA
jgi:hypothetical protein